MGIYDGIVTVADDEIPVMLELGNDRVRLSAAGTEIGEWAADECRISLVSDTTYAITAEEETIEFVPNQPRLFAAAVNGGSKRPAVPLPPEPDPRPNSPDGTKQAPPPKPLTMGLFYALCVATAALAVWSLINIFM